jgi:hypothetical protein
MVRFLAKNPVPLNISLLGFPGSGKTVYLTVLFDQLMRNRDASVRFAPYGLETIEAVTSNLNVLASGRWLPRTYAGDAFPYRATASVRGGLVPKKYKIEILDYAGEHMGELNPSEPRWLHKTDYFKYVIQSDAVVLALDAQELAKADRASREAIQNAYVAAFQVLAEEKGATEARLLRSPVALLFLKVDVLKGKPHTELEPLVEKLIAVCSTRCRRFRVFYASAVGAPGDGCGPPEEIHPEGVLDPLMWILKQAVPIMPSS